MRERRRRRSNQPQEALELFLAHMAEEQSLQAILLSDGDGLLLGGASRDARVDLEALAALRQGPDVRHSILKYAEATLYLVTQGRKTIRLDGARDAVARILSLEMA